MLESTSNEWSSSGDWSSMIEGESSSEEEEISLEVIGIALKGPSSSSEIPQQLPKIEKDKLERMLAKDLSIEQKDTYMKVVEKHSSLFIYDYEHITCVTTIQHHINLKDGARPVVQRL